MRAWRGELVLAHTLLHARVGVNLLLRDALAHLATPPFADIGLQLDVKHTGYGRQILDELRSANLLGRSMLCSQVPAVLDDFRALDPSVQVGISVGGRLARASRRWGDWRHEILAGLASRRWNALMAQHKLIDAPLVDAVARRDSRVYAWTVNERRGIDKLRSIGVHGITTGDPRLLV